MTDRDELRRRLDDIEDGVGGITGFEYRISPGDDTDDIDEESPLTFVISPGDDDDDDGSRGTPTVGEP